MCNCSLVSIQPISYLFTRYFKNFSIQIDINRKEGRRGCLIQVSSQSDKDWYWQRLWLQLRLPGDWWTKFKTFIQVSLSACCQNIYHRSPKRGRRIKRGIIFMKNLKLNYDYTTVNFMLFHPLDKPDFGLSSTRKIGRSNVLLSSLTSIFRHLI